MCTAYRGEGERWKVWKHTDNSPSTIRTIINIIHCLTAWQPELERLQRQYSVYEKSMLMQEAVKFQLLVRMSSARCAYTLNGSKMIFSLVVVVSEPSADYKKLCAMDWRNKCMCIQAFCIHILRLLLEMCRKRKRTNEREQMNERLCYQFSYAFSHFSLFTFHFSPFVSNIYRVY